MIEENKNNSEENVWLSRAILKSLQLVIVLVVLGALLIAMAFVEAKTGALANFFNKKEEIVLADTTQNKAAKKEEKPDHWVAPDLATIPAGEQGEMIKYGRELIAHTAKYLGPRGSVMQVSNGMNCQNCHLDAGTKNMGNNYGAVAATYPKIRARSGAMESMEKRINDCVERSLNGKALAEDSKEMKAIVAYMKWLGTDVPKGKAPKGSGIFDLPYLDRPIDPEKGKVLYEQKCASCHQKDGKGTLNMEGTEYTFPPLWGEHSYNSGAGLYRMSRFAGYIKYNMPLGVTYPDSQLTDEEAWDIAAYVNTMNRPSKDLSKDWPDISKKPIDHPFGPFADGFDEKQHKYGPFAPIKKKREEMKKGKEDKAPTSKK
ncbi:MAG: c-type cytochrome [Thermonemataceae bacterium]|nr:c-type cytochrome [Thermonemataceae bacterium]